MIERLRPSVMICLAVVALVYSSEVRAVEVEKKINLDGTWTVHGMWEDHEWEAEWGISQTRKKIRGYAYNIIPFTGKIKGSNVIINFTDGCKPQFEGTVSNNSMSGTFKCTADSDDSGTWVATKVTNAPVSPGASPFDPRE